MDKSGQRARLRRIRNEIPQAERRTKSERISDWLFNSEEYKSAETVLIYMSFDSEVMTDMIFDRILCDNKILCVPMCHTETCTMTAYAVRGASDLSIGSYGIAEPDFNKIQSGIVKAVNKSDIDLVIVPGLGFDLNGYRVGYGKGYYDRFLENFDGVSAGLCYECCRESKICHDEFDARVSLVITENNVLKTKYSTEGYSSGE